MTVWVLDLDKVLQDPGYSHPMLLAELAPAMGVEYSVLYNHYTNEFDGNEAEEAYHMSLCDSEDKREAVRGLWRKLHDNMLNVKEIPGAKGLLELIQARSGLLFAWTKGKKTEEIQRKRLESFDFSRFFLKEPQDHIISSPRKGTVGGLEQDLLPKLPQGKVVLVGDRFSQDIDPALNRKDITCVWIRWPDADELAPKISEDDYPNLRIVKSTQELASLVKKGAFDG